MASTVCVLAFGPVRARIGVDRFEVACADAISSEELWSRILARHPRLEALRPTVRLARDGEFLGPDALLRAGEEVALIPPVSGG